MRRPRIEQFVSGYLLMEIRGQKTQQVLLEMQRRGIGLYDVYVTGSRTVVGLSLSDFDDFYRACRTHHVKIRFIQREGLPFILRKVWRRKAMVAGLAVFFALIYTFSGIVWQVSVSGVEDDTRALVLQAAKDSGISRGVLKQSLPNAEQLQSILLKKLPNLMWIGVQMEGSKVNLEAVEKIPDTDPIHEEPHDIAASKPGVIRKVYANRGSAVVKPGQLVHPGQVIISGNLGDGSKLVPADGQVIAEVWYHSNISIPLAVTQSALTGAHVNRDYLTLGKLALRIWGFEQPEYQDSIEREQTSAWKIGSWELPIQWREVEEFEVSPAQIRHSQAEADQKAREIAAQDVRSQMRDEGEIIGQTVLHEEVRHGKLYATILTRTEENIGVVAPMKVPQKTDEETQKQKQS